MPNFKTGQVDEYLFKELEINQLDALVELESLIFSTPWSKEQYLKLIDAKICRVFGAFYKNVLVGYISLQLPANADEVEVYNIAVHPQHQRKGIANKLISLVLAACAKLKLERAVLEVREGNVPAIALYTKHGFTVCGKRKNYYTNPVENAILYEYIF